MPIMNDHELRAALDALTPDQQRITGARFAQSVIRLCQDERVRRAIDTGIDAGASASELEDAYRAAKAYATKTYTDCGKDTNWLEQADHFVAAAAAAALTPDALLTERTNRAWKAAMQVHMAENCELMEQEDAGTVSEAQRQYQITQEVAGA
jgi:hypothetical protein